MKIHQIPLDHKISWEYLGLCEIRKSLTAQPFQVIKLILRYTHLLMFHSAGSPYYIPFAETAAVSLRTILKQTPLAPMPPLAQQSANLRKI